MRKIKMTIGGIEITAELFDTPTADAIHQCLPFTSTAQTWGEEVYFSTPVSVPREAALESMLAMGMPKWVADAYGEMLENFASGGMDRTVDTQISNIRRKLEKSAGRRFVHTVYGMGYRFGDA